MRSRAMRGGVWESFAIGLAALWLLVASAPAQAARVARPGPTEATPQTVLPSQVPAAATPDVEANLARLHRQLNITPAQQPKFEAFANAMRENARMRPATPPANPTAVDDLRLTITDAELQLTALKRLLPPMQALYASLSAAQQKTADQVFREPPGGSGE